MMEDLKKSAKSRLYRSVASYTVYSDREPTECIIIIVDNSWSTCADVYVHQNSAAQG